MMRSSLALLILYIAYACAKGTVHPSAAIKVKNNGFSDVILELPSVMSKVLSSPQIKTLDIGPKKTKTLVASLKESTAEVQLPYTEILKKLNIDYEAFWLSNFIHVKGITKPQLETLLNAPGSFEIKLPVEVSVDQLKPQKSPRGSFKSSKQNEVQWGVAQIRAPEAWQTTRGEGSVVAIIDTGVRGSHVALSDNYGGHWYDAINGVPEPDDVNGHGTFIAGVAVGTDNGIGVAPGATWVACKGLNDFGSGTTTTLTLCAQWMMELEPTPDVVLNGWGGFSSEGFFDDVLAAWQAVGIVPVFPTGGSGSCGSVGYPGSSNEVLGVGGSDHEDSVSPFSSKGPTTDGRIKPDLVAPSIDIISAGVSSDYVSMSGTSIAGAHVAGAAALVRAANSGIPYSMLFGALTDTASRPEIPDEFETCGPGPEDYPNNAYGYGRVDVAAALELDF